VTKSVHDETVRIVEEQMKDISTQMQALDDFVARARSENAQHYDTHTQSLQGLSTTVRNSYTNISSHFTATYERVRDLGDEMSTKTGTLRDALNPLDTTLRQPLSELRSNISNTLLQEYIATGETPQKIQYQYPTELPRTQAHETLLAALRRPAPTNSSSMSPSKTIAVLNDSPSPITGDNEVAPTSTLLLIPSLSGTMPTGGLREINANIISAGTLTSAAELAPSNSTLADLAGKPPPPKRSTTGSGLKAPQKIAKKSAVVALEGRENSFPSFSQSMGRRRSPRTGLS
jgi:kinesin family protein 11